MHYWIGAVRNILRALLSRLWPWLINAPISSFWSMRATLLLCVQLLQGPGSSNTSVSHLARIKRFFNSVPRSASMPGKQLCTSAISFPISEWCCSPLVFYLVSERSMNVYLFLWPVDRSILAQRAEWQFRGTNERSVTQGDGQKSNNARWQWCPWQRKEEKKENSLSFFFPT